MTQRRLEEDQVEAIRAARSQPCPHCGSLPSLKMLAHRFGVAIDVIAKCANRRTYR